MVGTASATARSIVLGLSLAVMSAGSLVAFSLVAEQASVSGFPATSVAAAGPPRSVPAVVVEAPRTERGREQAPPQPADEGSGAAIVATAGGDPEPQVLGTRFANEKDRKPRNKDNDGFLQDMTETEDEVARRCVCDDDDKHKSSNGNAYGHYKPRGTAHRHNDDSADAKAQTSPGHEKAPGQAKTPPGHAKGRPPKKK